MLSARAEGQTAFKEGRTIAQLSNAGPPKLRIESSVCAHLCVFTATLRCQTAINAPKGLAFGNALNASAFAHPLHHA